MGEVGLAFDLHLLRPGALGGAVAPRRAGRSAIDLHELGEVHVTAKSALHGVEVGAVPVLGGTEREEA